MTIADLLNSTYSHHGMGPDSYNCWGLVRAALHHLYGLPLLPECGAVHPDNKPAMTAMYDELVCSFTPCGVEEAAVACFFEDRQLQHVGVVIKRRGTFFILHTDVGTGPVQTPARLANLIPGRVSFYRYAGVRS